MATTKTYNVNIDVNTTGINNAEKVVKQLDNDLKNLGAKKGADQVVNQLNEIGVAAVKTSKSLNTVGTEVEGGFTRLQRKIRDTQVALQKAQAAGDSVKFNKLKAELDELQDGLEVVNLSSMQLDDALQQVPGPASAAGNALKTLDGAAKIFAANPLVAIIGGITAALYGMYESLKTTSEGQKTLNDLSTSFSNIFTPIVTFVSNIAVPVFTAFGQVLNGIGFVFGVTNDKLKEAQINYEDLSQSIAKGIANAKAANTELQAYAETVQDASQSEQTRLAALKDLQKILPELEGLNLKQADAINKINAAVTRQRQINQVQNALAEIRNTIAAQELKIQQSKIKQIDIELQLQKELAAMKRGEVDYGREERIFKLKKAQNFELELQKAAQAEINEVQQVAITNTKDLVRLQGEQNKLVDEANKSKKEQEKTDKDLAKAASDAQAAREEAARNELAAIKGKNEALRQERYALAKEEKKRIDTEYANNIERLKEQQQEELKQKNLTSKAIAAINEKYRALGVVAEAEYTKKLYDLNKQLLDKKLSLIKQEGEIGMKRINEQEKTDEAILQSQENLENKRLENQIKATEDILQQVELTKQLEIKKEQEGNIKIIDGIFNTAKARKEQAKKDRDDIIASGGDKIKAEEQYQATLVQVDLDTNKQLEVQAQTTAENIVAINANANKQIIENDKKTAQERQQALQQFFALQKQVADAQFEYQQAQREKDLENTVRRLDKETQIKIEQAGDDAVAVERIRKEAQQQENMLRERAFNNDKQYKKAQAELNAAVAVTQAFAGLADKPILLALALATIAATTAAQIATINQTEFVPEYAEGGLVKGPGTGTSDSITAKISNGEFVMNAKSTQQYLPTLTAMNEGKTLPSSPVDTQLLEMLSDLKIKMSEPSKAYVLQGDVYNGVQAQSQINNKRKL